MSNVVNLTRHRKQKARADKRREADANALRHGLTKAEKSLTKAQLDKAARTLDGHSTKEDEA